MITMTKIDNLFSRESAERKVARLEELIGSTFYNFEFLICPAGGSFDLFVQSDYDFDGQDAEKDLLAAFTFCLVSGIGQEPAPAQRAEIAAEMPAQIQTVTPVEAEILEVVRGVHEAYQNGYSDCTGEDLVNQTELSPFSIQSALSTLIDKDLIDLRENQGVVFYGLTPAGFKASGGLPAWHAEA